MPPRPTLATAPDTAETRAEPSISTESRSRGVRFLQGRDRSVAEPQRRELRAGERLVVSSSDPSSSAWLKYVLVGAVVVLALVGAAALLRPVVGL